MPAASESSSRRSRDLGAERGDLLRRRVGPREPHDLVAALEQPGGQGAADEAAGAGYEDAGHR
jgi:hypothetical protein